MKFQDFRVLETTGRISENKLFKGYRWKWSGFHGGKGCELGENLGFAVD